MKQFIHPFRYATAPHPSGSTEVDAPRAMRHRTGWVFLVVGALVLVTVLVSGASARPAYAADTASYTIFGSAVPANPADTDTSDVVVGTKFSASVAGTVTGVRYYKSAQNTGTKVGTLWDGNGRALASVTFPGQASVGWQTATFASPVAVTAGGTYTASYRAPVGRYAGDSGALSSSKPAKSGALTATQGVYSYTGGFPTKTWSSSNYYVDVVFQPGTAPVTSTPTATPTATATPRKSVV